jgi:N-acyl-D-aspartate/D-glutamate deacylase
MMTRTEQIPYESMKQGMKWRWETFPEWLDNLQRLPKGVNIVSYVRDAQRRYAQRGGVREPQRGGSSEEVWSRETGEKVGMRSSTDARAG